MRPKILDQKRKKIFSQLSFINKQGFYLAGGTALALQISHRRSLDFDFYTSRKFDNQKLLKHLEDKFENVILIQKPEDTLIVTIDNIETSFFCYPYPLIKRPILLEKISLASLEDIAAMKIIAVTNRGTKRDFVDIHFLLKRFSLKDILGFVKKKYPNFNTYTALRGLTYFADAEKGQKRRMYLFENIDWKDIKKDLVETVKKYQIK